MSKHEVRIVKVDKINPHPNADLLEIIPIWDYECVVKKGQFQLGELVAYIEPDYLVPLDRDEFSFLQKPGKFKLKRRITVSKFRGVHSHGLIIKAPEGFKENDNALEHLGVSRYEPPVQMALKGAIAEKGPGIDAPKYDIENVKKHRNVIKKNEKVIFTAKIHGSNARFVYMNDRMYCGSRAQWKAEPGTFIPTYKGGAVEVPLCAWWEALYQNPWIESFCKENEGIVLYGEIYGPSIQGSNFHYGLSGNQIGFAVFDIFENGKWVPNIEFSDEKYSGLKFVKTLYTGKYDSNELITLAEEKETYNNAGHLREGVVIKPVIERFVPNMGRLVLKYVSTQYLKKS